MEDLSQLLESLWPEPKFIDTTAWYMVTVSIVALCLRQRLWV